MNDRPPRKSQLRADTDGAKCNRRWTATQLQRKRQLDRESQRVAREKTKNRLSHLEALVKTLQENDNDRVQTLLKKIDDQQAEIQKLRDIIRGIGRLIEDPSISSSVTEDATEPALPNDEPDPAEVEMSNAEEMPNEAADVPVEPSSRPTEPTSVPVLARNDFSVLDGQALLDTLECGTSQQCQTISQLAASIAEDQSLEGRLWYLAGVVLRHLLSTRDVEVPLTTCDDEDIAIRAVFEGWSTVTSMYHLDDGWQWLKELDERIYYHLPAHDRLGHMRNTRLVLINQTCPGSSPKSQIPWFFETRPYGGFSQYDPLVEHFPWPGFREKLWISPLKFATNRFMDTLRSNLDFMWNRSTHDLYTRNSVDGRYCYSDEFTSRLTDIRCYAARREFFDAFPELRADIPCSAVSLHSLFPLVLEHDDQFVEVLVDDCDEEESTM